MSIRKRELIIFAGAGVTKGLGLPTWPEFTDKILERLSKNRNLDISKRRKYRDLVNSKEDCFARLEKIDKGIARDAALSYIKKEFKFPANSPNYLHERLLNISGRIITTNFDNAFERAYETTHHGDTPPIVALGTTENDRLLRDLAENLSNHGDFIYKIHGCATNPDSCIVFRDKYNDFYEGTNGDKYARARSLLEQISRDFHILFIGWSFDDPFVKELFWTQCKNEFNRHYIVTTRESKYCSPEYPYLKPIIIKDYSKESMDGLLNKLESCKHQTPVERLQKMDIFHNMKRASLETIAGEHCVKLAMGDPLSTKGDNSSVFWIILDGTISAYTNSNGDTSTAIKKNDVIGELGFVLKSPRTRSIFCSSKTAKAIPITQNVLNKISKDEQEKLWRNIVFTYFKRIAKCKLHAKNITNMSWEDIAKIFSNNFREDNYDIENIEYYLLRFINETNL